MMDEFREVSAADVFREVTSPDQWDAPNRNWIQRLARERVAQADRAIRAAEEWKARIRSPGFGDAAAY